jgi:acetylornithine deacetylase/succinyl-diaminopimelate desuccinylase-like protein
MSHEAVTILSKYLQIDTSNPPGNEASAADFFAKIFDREKISCQIYESEPGRMSIRAALPGSGHKDPLILLNHMDVVPADRSAFNFDPFGGEIRDGYVCGRGAIDMKGIGVMQLMAFLAMKRAGSNLNRDLVFLAVADEEEGGMKGAHYLLEKHPDDFKAGLVLNEGAYGISNMLPNKTALLISPAEKGPLWIRISRRGLPGHGSMPHSKNALEKLTAAIHRLLSEEMPVTITPITADYFKKLSSGWPFLDPYMKDGKYETLARVLTQSGMLAIPALNAMVRNTISLNMLKAGVKINIIPDYAEAQLDIRLLPGQKIDDFINFVKEKLGDDEIKIETILASESSSSTTINDDFTILLNTLQTHFPDSLIPLSLLSGLSDSRFFRERGIPVYGFCPLMITVDQLNMIHGNDEKISVDGLIKGCEIYVEIVRSLCT